MKGERTLVFLPVLSKLTIDGYGLYPGDSGAPVEIDLRCKISLAIGANGLGKSTLINMLLRALTGYFDIPTGGVDSLGRANLLPRDIGRVARRYFAARVNDGASAAKVVLNFQVGQDSFRVERRLRDLELLALEKNGNALVQVVTRASLANERNYQAAIVDSARVGSFSDWLLLLRYVTFFQDDRRPLLWDGFAQSQVLRPLYLGIEESNRWLADERAILELDSDRRNLSAVLSRRELNLREESARLVSAPAINDRLEEVALRLSELHIELPEAQEAADEASSHRADARLALAEAEIAAESADRSYQHAKLQSLAELLPLESATTRYILSVLFAEEKCLACGNDAPEMRAQLDERVLAHCCVVCGHELADPSSEKSIELAPERLSASRADVSASAERLISARRRVEEESAQAGELIQRARELESEMEDLRAEESELVSRLPPTEQSMRDAIDRLDAMKRELEVADLRLVEMRLEFQQFVAHQTSSIFDGATRLENSFQRFASQFLLESSQLSWSPRLDAIGQTGQRIPFPQFSVSMTGADFQGGVARMTADSVSESQRHYIDLAFRMALVESATSDGRGTIVIDSPEAALDAVFEPRAASQLVLFASEDGRHLFMTSNVTSGDFLPTLLAAQVNNRDLADLVDLLDIARATAAVRERESDYRDALRAVKSRASELRENDD